MNYISSYNLPEDTAWLIVDMDQQQKRHLPGICKEARQEGFNTAISNPCFELWLWLHHFEVDMNLTNATKLKRKLGDTISGFDTNNWNPIENPEHQKWISDAISRAKALPGSNTELMPQFPGTQLWRLVERIMEKSAIPKSEA